MLMSDKMNKDHSEDQRVVLFYECYFYALSNFSSFAVRYKGRLWMTSEHLYQASKFLDGSPPYLEIYMATSAHDAKQIADEERHQVFRLKDFDDRKLEIMEMILRLKFDQHEYVRKSLFRTGDVRIVENSPEDSFWGRGQDWNGENHLGRIWMKIRDEKKQNGG